MKLQPAVLSMVMAIGILSGGCTSSIQQNGTGGSSGNDAGMQCPNETPCGGDVVGSWNVKASCLSVAGELDISLAGLDPRTCKNVKIGGSVNVTGTWSGEANGTYTDNTTTKGQLRVDMPAGCRQLSGTTVECSGVGSPLFGVGFTTVNCTDAASGGGCTCLVDIDQKGGLGSISADPQKSGNFTTSGNTLTLDGLLDYSYCVGSKTTVKPLSKNYMTSGTITLEKSSSPGTGGGSGTGGGGATGGSGGKAQTGGAGGSSNTGGRGGQAGSSVGTGGSATGGGGGGISGNRSDGPCDIYAAANVPCVAAYSTVRALTKTYSGPLYQVRSGSSAMNTGTGGMFKDIGLTADGFADSATQDTFCSGTTCTISLLYDQSGKKNNLKVAPKGLSNGGTYAAMDDFESSATKGVMMVGGHKVYSLYMNAREGYRLTAKGAGMPLGNTAEGIYMLADGTHYGTACCWDFGNVSPDPMKYGVMNTLFFGTGFWGKGAGAGPWFLGDFEGGVWAGGSGGSNVTNNNSPSMKVPFAFGILKTSPPDKYAIRMADLKTASELITAYDGKGPKTWNNEGGILIGIGGDNSNNSWGTFFEGAITAGLPSNDTDLAVMKNVQAAGYGK